MEDETEQVELPVDSSDSGEANRDVVSVEEIGKSLFECADHLRGHVDSGEYKDYILPLVFYAEMNRRFVRQYEKELREVGGIDEHGNINDEIDEAIRKIAENNVVDGIEIPSGHSWQSIAPSDGEEDETYAERIDEAFRAFEEANTEYEGMFEDEFSNVSSFLRGGNDDLREVLRIIDDTIYRDDRELPPDALGEAFMYLVKQFSENDAGEYFTPPRVTRLVVQLLEPFEPEAKFHDPTVGSGGFLVEAANQIEQLRRTGWYEENHDVTTPDENSSAPSMKFLKENGFEFTGQELNPTIAGMAKMNLALHNIPSRVRQGDSIANPQFEGDHHGELEQFDYILANFPFSESGWKDAAKNRQDVYDDLDWDDSLPHGRYGDYAFVMHMHSQLADEGQMATIIPHGVLFRGDDQPYREYMVENDLVEAVIGLPENLFEATGIPSAILVLNDGKPDDREEEVMFFNADHEGRFYRDTGENRNRLIDPIEDGDEEEPIVYAEMDDPYGTAEVKHLFDEWETEERVCRVVDCDEIRENDYNLNIALYVDTTEPQEDISVEDTLADIHDLETEYESLHDQLTTYMTQLNYEGDTDD